MSSAATLVRTNHGVRPRDVAHLDSETRQLRHQAAVWAIQTGEALGFDALTVILAAKVAADGQPTRWTEEDIWQLWWVDLMGWCAQRQLSPPADLAATLATLLHFLHRGPGLAAGSCALDDLLVALDGAGAAMLPIPTRRLV